MKKAIVILCIVLLAVNFSGICIAGQKPLILKFYGDPVYIYKTKDLYTKILKKNLPDPQKTKVTVKSYDFKTNMVMFEHQGKKMWVSITDVKLSTESVADVVCNKSGQSKPNYNTSLSSSGGNTLTTMGLGEDCN